MAPVLPDRGITLLTCAALGLIAIVVDIFATTMRMPALSGLGLIAVLITPAIVKPTGVGMSSFIIATLAYLLLIATAQWRENRFVSGGALASSGFAARSAVIGSAALVLTVLLPLLVPGFNSGVFSQGARINMWGTATGLNPAVTLGNDLRNPTGLGRITYSTNSDTPLYLRATTLEDFSGQRWEPDQRIDDRQEDVTEIGAEDGTPGNTGPGNTVPSNTVFTRITTQSYSSPWLLTPYAPMSIKNLSGGWAWDPANLSILATDGGSTARQDYLVQSASAELTRDRLGAIGPSSYEDVAAVFLQLPDDTPEIIRITTDEVTREFVNPYDKAMAIQSYLRSSEFTYSVEAPVDGGYDGSGMKVMARFLELKSGYCVHFAGTMAVMARVAGIPSRMAIGYTPGTSTGDTTEGPDGTELREFVVDSRNAHSWPELYFEGVGWVQFEPTPSRGVVPAYAQQEFSPVGPRADDTDALNPEAIPGIDSPTNTEAPQPATGGNAQAVGPQIDMRLVIGLVIVIGMVLLTSVPAILRVARTKTRRSIVENVDNSNYVAATAAWAETAEIAGDYGYPLEATDTPRVFAERLTTDASLQDAPAASLSRLRSVYEREEYSNPVRQARPGQHTMIDSSVMSARPMEAPSWADVDAVTRALRIGSSRSTRLKARLFPRSLLYRFRANPRR